MGNGLVTVRNDGSVANGRAIVYRRKVSIDRSELWVLGRSVRYGGPVGGGESGETGEV